MVDFCRVDIINDEIANYIDKEMHMFMFDEGSYIIKHNDTTIGMIDFEVFEKYIKINSIEIAYKYQNKGYGTKVIELLLEKRPMVCGEAVYCAVGFYATFDKVQIEENDMDDSIYFTIFK